MTKTKVASTWLSSSYCGAGTVGLICWPSLPSGPLDIDLFLDLQVQPLSRYPCPLLASGRRLRIRHPRQHALHNGLVAILRCLQQ